MIIEMPNTRTREISQKIDELHEERGESATGRVLTLLISTTEDELEQALELANAASREHPCRVIAISPRRGNGARKPVEGAPKPTEDADAAYDNSNLDAQVRFGADAGAGEIIVLYPRGGLVHHPDTLVIPLLVPDAPVVAWWPNEAPANPSHPRTCSARWRGVASPTPCTRRTPTAPSRICAATGRRRTWTWHGRA